MKFYFLLIKYRFWLSLVSLVLAILLNVTHVAGFWPSFPLYFLGVIGLASHFFIGPLRLVQAPMEAGNVEEVQRILKSIWYPNLLYAPIRSGYYTLKGNLAMMDKDFDQAEKYLKQSTSINSPLTQNEGSNKLQLGIMALQKGNFKECEAYVRASIRLGLPDKETEAVAFLTMCQIFFRKSQFKAGRDFYRKAKDCKPKNKEVVDQLKEMEKYISRLPG